MYSIDVDNYCNYDGNFGVRVSNIYLLYTFNTTQIMLSQGITRYIYLFYGLLQKLLSWSVQFEFKQLTVTDQMVNTYARFEEILTS